MNRLFSPSPILQNQGLAIIRIILGSLMIFHGEEIFQPELMNTYLEWDMFKGPNGKLMIYAGKSAEFIAGLSFFLGLFTRLGALLTIGTLSFITFFVGQGRFWYEDQHPFMFVLMGLVFLFFGPGAWSVDHLIFKRTDKSDLA
ncbi:MAG: DoxX family protein [Bacteroidota bacterium]